MDYLVSVREAAIAVLDSGRAWDGGIFEVLGSNELMSKMVINNSSFDRAILVGDAKSTFLSGGTLTALIFTVALVVFLLGFLIVSVFVRCKSSSPRYDFGQKLRVRVKNLNRQLPIPMRGVFGVVCVILLILALIPLILAFATNSRLHATVSETNANRKGSMVQQLSQAFDEVDHFLENLMPQARIDLVPVIDRTLDLTHQMKEKSQSAYQKAFQDAIGAATLKSNSEDLLSRIRIFYEFGKEAPTRSEIFTDISSKDIVLKRIEENTCINESGSPELCKNHAKMINFTMDSIKAFNTSWEQAKIKEMVSNGTQAFKNFASTLESTGKNPDQQEEMKKKKMEISRQFSQKISDVMSKKLNSTEFVLNSMNNKLSDLELKIDSARDRLSNVSAKALGKFSQTAPKYEKIRFAVTLILLLLLLLVLVYVSTTFSVVLFLPNTAGKNQNCISLGVYTSYFVYAIVLCFVFCLFGATSTLETEICRYLAEQPPAIQDSTIDRFVVPEINKILTFVKMRSREDPNKTDTIPLTGLNSLFGGIQLRCRKNLPLLVALNSTEMIDTTVGDTSSASMAFKMKGLEILKEEMNKANLSVLRDTKMNENMRNLQGILSGLETRDLNAIAKILENFTLPVQEMISKLHEMQKLNLEMKEAVSHPSSIDLMQMNEKTLKNLIESFQTVADSIDYFVKKFNSIEPIKRARPIVDEIISANSHMEKFLTNQTLWTETAAKYYTEYVIERSTEESNKIAKQTTVGFLSSVAKCRKIYDLYQTSTGIPCQTILYPVSILWFTLGWSVLVSIVFSLFAHLSIACFTKVPGTRNSLDAAGLPSKLRAPDGQEHLAAQRRGDANETLLEGKAQTGV